MIGIVAPCLQPNGEVDMKSDETTWIKARDVYEFVGETFAAGPDEWPVPRSVLNGLSLRQVLDGIKIAMAQIYLEARRGDGDIALYNQLKSRWGFLLVSLPIVFTRNETWLVFDHLHPEKRHFELMTAGQEWFGHPERMNAEELELYNEPESLASFLEYVEKMERNVENAFEHVLGHLSQGTIYIDDLIPVRDRQGSRPESPDFEENVQLDLDDHPLDRHIHGSHFYYQLINDNEVFSANDVELVRNACVHWCTANNFECEVCVDNRLLRITIYHSSSSSDAIGTSLFLTLADNALRKLGKGVKYLK
jgi:hypothetical protein